MPDYSYECTKATIREDLGVDANGDRMLFCNLEFENENGHSMAPVDGIVVLRGYGATIATDACDILDDSLPDAEWGAKAEEFGEKLESGAVGFDIYNQEAIAEALRKELG